MKRRNWVFAGAGVAAVAAGAAWQRWREAAAMAPADAGGASDLWQMSFVQPDGSTLQMASLLGHPLVLNFWGTWCPPCVKEMPELDRFARQFGPQGWRVLGLAVDNPTAVREFLARSPVSYTIALAGFEGSDLTYRLGNHKAGLPFTVVFDRKGVVVQRTTGATSFEELAALARKS
jgi:thiol-disulfide isomerase/thioredoxin